MSIDKKFNNLKNIIASMESMVIAYSGGVDSTFLLKVASQVLEDRLLAVTAMSASFPHREVEFAKKMAKELEVEHLVIQTNEMEDDNFVRNGEDRCYWCKKELFLKLRQIARKKNLAYVADGANSDDAEDYRPGLKAASDLGVRSPLKEANLNKGEIRELSYSLGLPTWCKPSFACLASRFPYGTKITEDILKIVDKAEKILLREGFSQVRVRHHGDIARIEVPATELSRLIEKKELILTELKKLNYLYITIDLEGYRSGSMNQTLKKWRDCYEKNIS